MVEAETQEGDGKRAKDKSVPQTVVTTEPWQRLETPALDAGPLAGSPLDTGPLDAGPLDAGPLAVVLSLRSSGCRSSAPRLFPGPCLNEQWRRRRADKQPQLREHGRCSCPSVPLTAPEPPGGHLHTLTRALPAPMARYSRSTHRLHPVRTDQGGAERELPLWEQGGPGGGQGGTGVWCVTVGESRTVVEKLAPKSPSLLLARQTRASRAMTPVRHFRPELFTIKPGETTDLQGDTS
uniref:Uncharacterized protein n=1 Tax=Knipowitschia caucasica TaxID=637954 RepID=A0AAV2JZM6_KNICA